MKTLTIIAQLDFVEPNLVKVVYLKGLRILGKPKYLAKHFYENVA